MQRLVGHGRWLAWLVSAALVAAVGSLTACDDDDEPGTGPAQPPEAVTVSVATMADTVTVSWTAAATAASYRVELRANPDTLTKAVGGDVTEVSFTAADDGLEDEEDYSAVVFSISAEGETASENTPTVSTNFFPWDEYYPASLHATGQGKKTFYNESPNGGFEQFTGIAYTFLSCKNCHEPSSTGGCSSCHDSDTPGLGATVDASLSGVCGNCHGRQKAEALVHGYSDVHRDAGMDCMGCHTLGDVHGDGNAYSSMLEEGAIDAKCENCHTTLASNSYHDTHAETVDCSACHIQSVVTCYNCHFETELQLDQKKAYGQFKDWIFLVNRGGKVHAANFQSVKYGNNTFVGMAPFYAHTIARNARECDDCHNSAALNQYVTEGVIDVARWDDMAQAMTHVEGVVPIPPDYQTALIFDFVDLDQPGGTVWSFLKTGADVIQLLFAEPLTQEQMDGLD